MISRIEIENLEGKSLSGFAMRANKSRGRKYKEKEHPYRTCFQRDRDRIIHCGAFRRLEYKTQVFVNHEGDYYRTRLTHTLEVAQISRSIARTLEVNEDLTEAIALAHDLGHTPFGHSGEEVLHTLMKEYGGSFEHNRQSWRIVEELESCYPDFPGLNLTYEVREGIIKHKTSYDQPVIKGFEPKKSATIEAQIVNVADEIAYSAHDLDDGLTAGYLQEEELKEVNIWKEICSELNLKNNSIDKEGYKYQAVRLLINKQVTDLLEYTSGNIVSRKISSLDDVRKNKVLVEFSPAMREKNIQLKKFLYDRLYNYYKVKRMMEKAKRFIKELFHAYMKQPLQLPPEVQQKMGKFKTIAAKAQVVCDYIAGMTDRSVQDEYMKLFMPYEKV